MDPQKHKLTKHSSTASRLTQTSRFALRPERFRDRVWDISIALTQGFFFKLLENIWKSMNLPVPLMPRKAYIIVPGNVWKHLLDLGFKCPNTSGGHVRHCIDLLKAMYGLCDAPLLWHFACAISSSACLVRLHVIKRKATTTGNHLPRSFWQAPQRTLMTAAWVEVTPGLIHADSNWRRSLDRSSDRSFRWRM